MAWRVDIQLFGLATCQNTHGGPFATEGDTSLFGFLEVCGGPPLAAYSFGLQIGKLRCCPELAPGTLLEYCKGWLVRHGRPEITCILTTARPDHELEVAGSPTENYCSGPSNVAPPTKALANCPPFRILKLALQLVRNSFNHKLEVQYR